MVLIPNGMKPRPAVKYRHMMPEDVIVWTKFLKNDDVVFDEVWYDLRVGLGIEVDTAQPEWLKRMADYTHRKRIDVVARRGEDYWIIEAKPFAGVVAFGQALYYAEAFKAEYRPPAAVIPCVVTDICDKDVLPVFDSYGVVVFEVGRSEEE